jgi:DNA (cytosine-5)-methyltransferase 1
MDIGKYIKEKREKLGLTQKEFADALGLGKYGDRTLRRWENGETNPSPLELKYIQDFPEDTPFPNPPLEESHFLIVDLFAGIGGIRLPFQELGGHTVFTSEWDKFAQKTYRINYGVEPDGDITQIHETDIPDHNILLAGFPCQPFSQAGLKKGFEDMRGTLFFDIARILAEKRPDAFLLENVKQLRGHDKGRTLDKIKKTLSDLNYTVHIEVLRAADFGVPQNRERIYIVGFNNEIHKAVPFKFPNPINEPTRVGNILESKVNEKYTISDRLYEGHLRRKEMHKLKGNGFGFSLFNAESPYTNTISARYYKDGSEILIDQGPNKNPRKLTPREAARLQGFPEEFVIPVSDTQAYRQFGNSVSVPVVRAIAHEMIVAMDSIDFLTDLITSAPQLQQELQTT